MEGKGEVVCAFCSCLISCSESRGREILERFREEFIVPFNLSVFGDGGSEAEVLGNWTICGGCVPGIKDVLGSKEKVGLMEVEVRKLQREILGRMKCLVEEMERICDGLGVIWGMMGDERKEQSSGGGGEAEEWRRRRRRFRNQVGNVLLDLQSFREETSGKLLKGVPVNPIETKTTELPSSPEEECGVSDVDEEDERSCDDCDNFESGVDEEDKDPSDIIEEEEEDNSEEDHATSEDEEVEQQKHEENSVASNETSREQEEEEPSMEEEDEISGEEEEISKEKEPALKTQSPLKILGVQKLCTENSSITNKPAPKLSVSTLPGKWSRTSRIRERLITKISEGESIATSPNLPSSPLDDPRRNYSIQYNSDHQTFHLSGIEIKCLDHKNALQCTGCDVICYSSQTRFAEEILFDHILGMHLKVYKCPFCKEEEHFSRNHAYYIAHIHESHGGLLFPCDICGKRFQKPPHLKAHKWSHLSKEEKADPANSRMMPFKPVQNRPPSKPRLCPLCGKQFTTKTIHKHLKTHNEDRKRICPDCGRNYVNKMRYQLHRQNGCERRRIPRVEVPCPVCGTSFQNRKVMWKHLRNIHPDERRYTCEICGMRFKTEPDVVLHRKRHPEGGREEHICENCGAVLSSKKSLNVHKKMSCGKERVVRRMDTSKLWERKMQEPVEIRPFPCDVCKRRFRTANQMRGHRRLMHFMKEGHFSCGLCGRNYMSSSGLRRHEKKCGVNGEGNT